MFVTITKWLFGCNISRNGKYDGFSWTSLFRPLYSTRYGEFTPRIIHPNDWLLIDQSLQRVEGCFVSFEAHNKPRDVQFVLIMTELLRQVNPQFGPFGNLVSFSRPEPFFFSCGAGGYNEFTDTVCSLYQKNFS